ncbi:MAG: hypothetical protein AAF975_07835, partial [Spirochaetota bacterium]
MSEETIFHKSLVQMKRKPCKNWLIFCFFILITLPLNAQEPGAPLQEQTEEQTGEQTGPAPPNISAAAPETEITAEERLQELRNRSLQSDVATATYLELQKLARELGLDPNLDVQNLRASLYNKLQVAAPAQASAKSEDLIVRIESAQKAQGFTVERQPEEEEDYFKISGGVKIFITDQKEGLEHSVQADSITFNR